MSTAVAEPKNKGGRPPKARYKLHPSTTPGATAQEILDAASSEAAFYLRAVSNGEERKPEWMRISAAQFLLKEHLGQVRAQGLVDEAGRRIVSYKVLVLMAQQFMSSGEPVQIEAAPTDGMVQIPITPRTQPGEAAGATAGGSDGVHLEAEEYVVTDVEVVDIDDEPESE